MCHLRSAICQGRNTLHATAITLFVLVPFCVTQAQTRYEPNAPNTPNAANTPLEPQPAQEPAPAAQALEPIPAAPPRRSNQPQPSRAGASRERSSLAPREVLPGPTDSDTEHEYRLLAEELKRQAAQMPAVREALERQMKSLQQQLDALKSNDRQAGNEEKSFMVFQLEHAKAHEVVETISGTLGRGDQLSIAVDSPGNRLLVRGTSDAMQSVAKILDSLDQPTPSGRTRSGNAIQLRLMWLVGGLPNGVGDMPRAGQINPQVLQALDRLGFVEPKVICHQIATVVVRPEEPSQFSFETPVIVNGTVISFQGSGSISGSDMYKLELVANTSERISTVERGTRSRTSQMGGSIALPAKHYVILGATNLVVGNESPGGDPQLKSYPNALVAFIEPAGRFSEEAPTQRQDGGREPGGREGATGRDRGAERSADNPFGR